MISPRNARRSEASALQFNYTARRTSVQQSQCLAAARHGSHMVESLISDILFGFTGLISIINPIGIAFVFLDRTASLTTEERTALARKIAINVVCVLLVAFLSARPFCISSASRCRLCASAAALRWRWAAGKC